MQSLLAFLALGDDPLAGVRSLPAAEEQAVGVGVEELIEHAFTQVQLLDIPADSSDDVQYRRLLKK